MVIGEIKRGKEIGSVKELSAKFMWCACDKCGGERWVRLNKGIPVHTRCVRCFPGRPGETNGQWRGGRFTRRGSYVMVWVSPDDFFRPMGDSNGYIREHRLVMAHHLNRCLLRWEIVHHRNGIKDDNRLENLEVIGCRGKHNTQVEQTLKLQAGQIKDLQARVLLLELENALLKRKYADA